MFFVGIVGGLTCFFFSLVGVFQFDVKKIVAYSTCSQLGYMFFSCAISNYSLSLFHLFNHAFFKALLFLSMGSIIHAVMDEQDFRRMGGLLRLLPFTYIVVLLGSFALIGFPFLTGFYSKDFLLEFVFVRFTVIGIYIYILGISGAFFSAFYSIRLIYWVFFSKPNFFKKNMYLIHEPGIFMTIPLFVLAYCSIFIGFVFSDQLNGIGSFFFDNSVIQYVDRYSFFDAEFFLFFVKYVPLFVSLFGVFFFKLLIRFNVLKMFDTIYVYLYTFFSRIFFFDFVYVDIIFCFIMKMSYSFFYKFVEKRLMEFFVFFLIKYLYLIFDLYKTFNKGIIIYYFFFIVLFFLIIFFFLAIFNFFDVIFVFFLLCIYVLN